MSDTQHSIPLLHNIQFHWCTTFNFIDAQHSISLMHNIQFHWCTTGDLNPQLTVEQTICLSCGRIWMFADGLPVGVRHTRSFLTEQLKKHTRLGFVSASRCRRRFTVDLSYFYSVQPLFLLLHKREGLAVQSRAWVELFSFCLEYVFFMVPITVLKCKLFPLIVRRMKTITPVKTFYFPWFHLKMLKSIVSFMCTIASNINGTPKGVYLFIITKVKFVTAVKFHYRVLQLTAIFLTIRHLWG